MTAQVVAVVGMYYIRAVHRHRLADSDIVVFHLPMVAAMIAYVVVFRMKSEGATASVLMRLLLGVGLAVAGQMISMLIALNTWGG